MVLLTLGNFTTGWDGSICDELHIARAFKDLGWEVYPVQREEWHELPDVKPDIILIAQWSGFSDLTIRSLREKYQAPIVYWAFDYHGTNHSSWHLELAKGADLFLSKELDNQDYYRQKGCNFQWFSQDFAPEFLDRYVGLIDKKYDILFTGSYIPHATWRNDLMKKIDDKFELHIFSVTPNQWKQAGFNNTYGPVMDHGLPELYAKAKINLSVDWKQADGYWSDRVAQILCCDGYVLNKYVPMQENIFYDYIDYFHSIEGCLQDIEAILNNESWLLADGYEFAHAHLKVNSKVKNLINMLHGKGIV